MALLYTLDTFPVAFWHAIEPFWPILLILWGASIILGRHWFSRFIAFHLHAYILYHRDLLRLGKDGFATCQLITAKCRLGVR